MEFNKKFVNLSDRKHAIIMYLAFTFIMICLLTCKTNFQIIQGSALLAYNILLIITIIAFILCIIFTIKKNLIYEGITLNVVISTTIILLLEKTVMFIINAPIGLNSFGFYINYIDITIIKLVFLTYRFSRVKQMLKSSDAYTASRNEYDNGVKEL